MNLRPAIEKLHAYIPGERRADSIKLSSNENPRGCSPSVRQAIMDAGCEVHIYPDGAARELTTAIAAHHGVDPAAVITGNGSDEVLTFIAATYLNPGDNVLVGRHTFSQYAFAARLFDAEVRRVPMPGLAMHPEQFCDFVDERTRVIFLCSPNNPTGTTFTGRELTALLERVSQEVLVVVDHAYVEYQHDPDAAQADSLLAEHPNLLVLHTFSKVNGIAALRLGYGLGAPERIAELARVRPPFSVNSLAQSAGRASIADREFVRTSLEQNARGRERMEQILTRLDWSFLPTQANFVTTETPIAADQAAAYIADRGVTVRALTSFGLPRWLRITIGTDAQIDRLEPILHALAESAARSPGR